MRVIQWDGYRFNKPHLIAFWYSEYFCCYNKMNGKQWLDDDAFNEQVMWPWSGHLNRFIFDGLCLVQCVLCAWIISWILRGAFFLLIDILPEGIMEKFLKVCRFEAWVLSSIFHNYEIFINILTDGNKHSFFWGEGDSYLEEVFSLNLKKIRPGKKVVQKNTKKISIKSTDFESWNRKKIENF